MTENGYARSPDYYYAVAALLLAGDIQSRIVSNAEGYWIQVSLVDGSQVLWSNARDLWGYSILSPKGEISSGDWESLPWDISVDNAAKMIAMHDYPSPAEWPEEQPRVV